MSNLDAKTPSVIQEAHKESDSSGILNLLKSDRRLVFLKSLEQEIPLHEGGRICEILMEQLATDTATKDGFTRSLEKDTDAIKEALYKDGRLNNIEHLDYKFGLIVTRLQELDAQRSL